MTVKQMIAYLATVDQDALVVCPGSDHSFYPVESLDSTQALKYGRRDISEVFDDSDQTVRGKLVNVVVLT